MIWWPRCTADALSGTRHIILTPLPLLAIVIAPSSGGVNHITPVLSMTLVSVQIPVPFPHVNPHVPSYCPITPNPCTLGQQVTILLSRLIVLLHLVSLLSGS